MILIITGCIKPHTKVKQVCLIDSKEREREYIESIEYFIKRTDIQKIVYCDNSGYDLDCSKLIEIAKTSHKQFEYIQFEGNLKKTIERGKGYGEGEMMEYAISHSKILNSNDFIFKITGRLIVKNFNEIIDKINQSKVYLLPHSFKVSNDEIDTRFYAMPIHIYNKFFRQLYYDVDDINQHYIEHCFYDCITNNNIESYIFPRYPYIIGRSGSTGKNYAITWRQICKNVYCGFKSKLPYKY